VGVTEIQRHLGPGPNLISWSHQALPETAARVFRSLSLHPGPDFSEAAAVALAGIQTSADVVVKPGTNAVNWAHDALASAP
jgi:hypothetical protein